MNPSHILLHEDHILRLDWMGWDGMGWDGMGLCAAAWSSGG
jgi:hypothetical protein